MTLKTTKKEGLIVSTYEQCIKQGNPISTGTPRQCFVGNNVFIEGTSKTSDETLVTKDEASDQGSNVGTLTETEALAIAKSSCIKEGETITPGTWDEIYNTITKTWWFNVKLNSAKPGCNPACVVSDQSQTAEINWRCTGVIPPSEPSETIKEISCPTNRQTGGACIALYQPVCAEVQIQCFTTPCNPIKQTFGNSCEACNNSLVSSYTEGECAK